MVKGWFWRTYGPAVLPAWRRRVDGSPCPFCWPFITAQPPILGRERTFYLCEEICSTESLIFLIVWPSKLWVDKILQPLKHSVCLHWMPIHIKGMSRIGPAFLWPPPQESVSPLSGSLCSSSSPVRRQTENLIFHQR